MDELRLRNQSAQLYVRALSQAWRNGIQIHDPSLWLLRDPETEEKMLRDADIAHAVGFRRHLIAGREWTMQPKVEAHERAPMAVHVATETVKGIKHFSSARLNLARAFFSGARFAEIKGHPITSTLGDGKPRTWWMPRELIDMDKRRFRIRPERDAHNRPRAVWQIWDFATDTYVDQSTQGAIRTIRHVYQDDEATLGHGRALREALGWWWYAKTHVFQESLSAVERFAQGILTAKIDGIRDAATGLPNTQLIAEWTAVLEDLRARHVIVSDKSDEIDMVKMDAQGWQLLHTIREELRSTIFTLVLGANLTTAASEGGSYALAEIQENSTEALVQFDRETLEDTLSDDLLGCIWYMNHANMVELGIHDQRPRFSITQEKRQDPKERAEVANVLHGMGVDLSMQDLMEQTGFKAPEDGETIVAGATAPVGDPAGLGGLFRGN